MTLMEGEVAAAREAIYEFGCPICGEEANGLTVQYLSAIEIEPCGHLVFPEDAQDMLAFYRKLWSPAYEEDTA